MYFAEIFPVIIEKNNSNRVVLIILLMLGMAPFAAFAQYARHNPPPGWFLSDPNRDSLQGMGVTHAYEELLAGRPSRTIIVAVLDTGVDIDHEDLRPAIWTNEDEVAGNGLDDDGNGYVDDVHGWNFLGGPKGNVTDDTFEITREYERLNQKFGGKIASEIPPQQKKAYQEYLSVRTKFERERDQNMQEYTLYSGIYRNLRMSVDTLKYVMRLDTLTLMSVDTFRATTPTLAFARGYILSVMKRANFEQGPEELLAEVRSAIQTYEPMVKYGYNPAYDSRGLIGDVYTNLKEKHYGNADVKGADPEHGTHVAGIIAAIRSNAIGIEGIANNVRIMPVLVTPPNGDERDKDVANGIRYAADNGAHIINMSFGKPFSPDKQAVDDAVRYAEQKGVIIVHAAGNEGDNIDEEKNFPSRQYLNGREATHWLEVGATGWGTDDHFVASFTNYGRKTVDLFAPGVDIYSTVPGNKYKNESGTSMSSPAAAGVIAMLWSYFPDLTATELLDIVRRSTRKFDGLIVQKPRGGKVKFSELSKTGGVVDAYAAVRMAANFKRQVEN